MILENIFPEHWTRLMKLAASFRNRVLERWADNPAAKNMCYQEFLEIDWKSLFKSQNDEPIEAELERILSMPE